jgi:hypothetical protein
MASDRPRLDEVEEPSSLRAALGEQPADDQDAVFDASEVDRGPTATLTDLDEANPDALTGALPFDPDATSVEWLTDTELRDGETDDPIEAAQEGLTYVPPTDPPITENEEGELEIAAGFGDTALAEPFDEDHHDEAVSGDDEMTDRVREALRAEASTTAYADAIDIETAGGVVLLRGRVSDLEDEDNLVAATERVTGVTEVVDELKVEGID